MRFVETNEILKAYHSEYHKIVSAGETRPEKQLAYYDSEVRYTDDCINQIFSVLQELNIANDTLVVITSDHGEAFGEYGFFDHLSCYENVSHIPLIFWWPQRIPKGQRVKGFSLGVDVIPTLLELAGLPVPEDICGRSLVNVDISEKEGERLGRMRLALGDWLARELNGKPDLLCSMVPKGPTAWKGICIQRILSTCPGILLKDPDLKKILINRFGPAVELLELTPKKETYSYYPGM